MAGPAMTLDENEIQGLVLQGYGKLRGAAYLLLHVPDAPHDTSQAGTGQAGTGQAGARRWLGSLLPSVTFGSDRPDTAVNVAFTAGGLARFGLGENAVAGFSLEFQEGMTSPHRRRLLGDVGAAAPENWRWGGPDGPGVHALLMLFAPDTEGVAALVEEHRTRAEQHGLRVLAVLDTHDLGFVEHFGFRDGQSQPALAGSARAGSGAAEVPDRDLLNPGEFILGYPNEHEQYPPSPLVDPGDDPGGVLPVAEGPGRKDFGRNGSYLVLRTLAQDVPGFWRFLDDATRRADGSSDPEARTALAARFIGRWPSGASLTLARDTDRPDLAGQNDFAYHADDAHGLGCPIGAHVRRANPRDSLPPRPGEPASVAVNKRHRLLRRGRTYGTPLSVEDALRQSQDQDQGDERGLHFVALCADIARQFEFVTHTWLLNPHFDGLYDDTDPILGGHHDGQAAPSGSTFTRQARPVRRRIHGIPPFVTVRGGAYFFLPGRAALRHLAR